jgi:eukaryotic-like serine/threonine-protein kinase
MLVTVLALGALAAANASGSAYFRANPQHSGVYGGSGVPVLHGVKWKFRTGGAVLSTPAVVDGKVFFGSSDHQVYALDERSGKLLWKFATHGRVTSSPAVVGGQVYLGSFDGSFYALNAEDGKLAWKFVTAGERRFSAKHLHGAEPASEVMPDPFDVFLSSPAVVAGVVYFGSGDGDVYALDSTNGTLRWKFQTGDVVHASPAVADGVVYIGSWDSYFYALDAVTGRERWRFKTGTDPAIHNQEGIQSSAVVADGLVYFGCRDSNLYALDAVTGGLRWKFPNKGSWVIGSPAVRNRTLYFATSDSARLHAVDAKTGAEIFSLEFAQWPFFSSPSLGGNFLYIGSHAGKLLGIDLSARKTAWAFRTDGEQQNGSTYTKADGTPNYEAAFGDSFYDDLIIGFHRMMSVGAIMSTPVIDGDTIFFGSWDGQLYAIG